MIYFILNSSIQVSHQPREWVRGTGMVEKERRTGTSSKRLRLQRKPSPKRRNPMLANQPKRTIQNRHRSQRRKRQRRAQGEVRRNNRSRRRGRAVRGAQAKRFRTPPELHLKPFQTPRHRLSRLQVATRSRTRSLTVLDFMVSSKGPSSGRSSTRS